MTPYPGVTAQRCADGRVTSVTAYADDLAQDGAAADRAVQALDRVAQRLA